MTKFISALMLAGLVLTVGCHHKKKGGEMPVQPEPTVVEAAPMETTPVEPAPVQGPAP